MIFVVELMMHAKLDNSVSIIGFDTRIATKSPSIQA